MENNINVKGTDFSGKEIAGKLVGIAGFGNVAIIKISEDRLEIAYCEVKNIEKL